MHHVDAKHTIIEADTLPMVNNAQGRNQSRSGNNFVKPTVTISRNDSTNSAPVTVVETKAIERMPVAKENLLAKPDDDSNSGRSRSKSSPDEMRKVSIITA